MEVAVCSSVISASAEDVPVTSYAATALLMTNFEQKVPVTSIPVRIDFVS